MLEDEPDATLLNGGPGLIFAGDRDPARIGAFEAGDHTERRALARPTRSQQRGDLAVFGHEADVVDRPEPSERLRQPLDLDASCHQSASAVLLRLNVSIPISNTIENVASVNATMYPCWSWY